LIKRIQKEVPEDIFLSNLMLSSKCIADAEFTNPALKEEITRKLWQLYNDAEFKLIKNRANKVLRRLQPQSIIDLLLNQLKDSDSSVRKSAASALGAMGSLEALPALLEAFRSDTDSDVRWSTAIALGAIGSIEALPSLVQALRIDINPDIRRSAAIALGAIGSPEAIPFLIQALENDKNCDVRGGAAEALGKIGDDTAIQSLEEALEDDGESAIMKVKDKAFKVLEKISRRTGKRILSRK
jgi:HEAT repeat protein